MPSNCFKIDISCISCGGKAGIKAGDSFYGGAGGGGGFVQVTNLFLTVGYYSNNLIINISSTGKIEES